MSRDHSTCSYRVILFFIICGSTHKSDVNSIRPGHRLRDAVLTLDPFFCACLLFAHCCLSTTCGCTRNTRGCRMQGLLSLSFCLISRVSSQYLHLFCISRHMHLLEILKSTTFRTNNGYRFSTYPRSGASLHFASWH